MFSTTNPKGMQTPTTSTTAGGKKRQDAQKRRRVEVIFWFIGLIILVATCIIIHLHPRPYPIDITTTQAVQGLHMPSWLLIAVNFPSLLNNPIPSEVSLAIWFVGLSLTGLINRLRGKPAIIWFQAAVFLALTVMSSAALNVVIDELVRRPRPNPKIDHIHLYTPLVPFPTYPSGHTEHDVAFYGFLLYLSFTRTVREWRFRWLLLPLQLYAVYDILAIGFSRILLGDHWLTDVLGGYLEGAVFLFFFIFLYRWITHILAMQHAKQVGNFSE